MVWGMVSREYRRRVIFSLVFVVGKWMASSTWCGPGPYLVGILDRGWRNKVRRRKWYISAIYVNMWMVMYDI